ncbi:MAG: hypothetical protein EBT63_04975 [Proteobacteria bacterium]|jgi:hypothetical protein|nr:hypothetical protein [Pseudomonadota bacterium]
MVRLAPRNLTATLGEAEMQQTQETVISEIKRQQNRQIARTLDDLADLKLPKLVEERIKQGFYDFADNLIKLIQDTQNDKSNTK